MKEKIVLANGKNYDLVTNGVSQIGDTTLKLRILAGTETVPEVQVAFTSCESITVTTEEGIVLQSPFTEFRVLKSVKVELNIVVEQKNIGTEEVPEYQDISVDVIEVVLTKRGIEERLDQMQADLEYIAMESGAKI